MPTNVVKTKADEKKWDACKASVKKAHPNWNHDSNRFYATVMACFKKKKGK